MVSHVLDQMLLFKIIFCQLKIHRGKLVANLLQKLRYCRFKAAAIEEIRPRPFFSRDCTCYRTKNSIFTISTQKYSTLLLQRLIFWI